ncbi:MAG: hypothetical protein GC185_00150 [Alphaproteobacteria bacterium]|nr:hypothetical protein [Alphaproteobacteria bacterium]
MDDDMTDKTYTPPDAPPEEPENPNAEIIAKMKGNLRLAYLRYRLLLCAGLVYVAAVMAQVFYCHAPLSEVGHVFTSTYGIFMKSITMLGLSALAYYVRCFFKPLEKGLGFSERAKQAADRLEKMTDRYFSAEVFFHGVMGLLVLSEIMVFFFQKSLLPTLNRYSWDPEFAAWDKAVHFGHYPHRLIMGTVERLHLQGVFDKAYLTWFIVMICLMGYNLFWDRDLKRRLQYLWTFFLSWVVCGSLLAVAFSSVGPMFYHHFYPLLPDPYADLTAYINRDGEKAFPMVFYTRGLLLDWAGNGKIVNPNAISAMPSMHVGIAWLTVLYTRRIGWKSCTLATLFWLTIMLAAVYFGFHYAIDGYVSIVVITFMWWLVGKGLDRRYPPDKQWVLEIV